MVEFPGAPNGDLISEPRSLCAEGLEGIVKSLGRHLTVQEWGMSLTKMVMSWDIDGRHVDTFTSFF